MNAYDLDYLDFSKPWWNNRFMDELTLDNDCRFFLVSDYLISALLYTEIVLYNKVIYANTHEHPDEPYRMVLDGTWTIDQMAQIAKDAFIDINNDGKADLGDQLGYVTYAAVLAVVIDGVFD